MAPFRFLLGAIIGFGLVVGSSNADAAARSRESRVRLGAYASTAPRAWREVPRPRPPRLRHFVLPRAPGDSRDGDLIIFHFGPGGGGTVDANLARWETLMESPSGSAPKARVTRWGKRGFRVTTLELQGTYLYRHRPLDLSLRPQRYRKHRLIGVVFECIDGPYFIRVVGPRNTIAKHQRRMQAWLRGFR